MVSSIIEELKGRAKLFDGEYKAYYEQVLRDARPVDCVPMKEAFSPEQMEFIREYGFRTHKKECYKNATQLINCLVAMNRAFDLPPFRYVEGYARSFVMNVEHAFVKIGDKYIDPTFERALRLDVRQEEYVSLIELEPVEMWKMQLETGYYGDLYKYSYMKRFRPEMAAKMRSLNPLKR